MAGARVYAVSAMRPLGTFSAVAALAAWTALACEPAEAARIAVFDNPAYVDTSSRNEQAESDSIQASLTWLGHRVSPFEATEAAAMQSAIGAASVVVIPELENRDLAAALSEAALGVLRTFVLRGGDLLVHGTSDQRASNLLNTLFGWKVTSGTVGNATIGPDAPGTPFAGAPSRINANQRTRGLDLANLPDDAEILYVNRTRAPVVLFRQGTGRVLYLGWDWYQAVPLGDADGGWLRLLVAAIGDEAPCRDEGGVDRDGNGVIDSCSEEPEEDGCAQLDTRRITARGTWIEFANPRPDGFREIFFNGVFKLPSRTSFADLDPRRVPFVFSVLDAEGNPQVAQTFPAVGARANDGVGWRFNPRDAKWVFDDPSGESANGFTRVVAKDLDPDSPGRVRFRASGNGGSYPVKPTGDPLSISIVVGDSELGQCAEATFEKSQCFVEKKTRSVRCRY
jgi:hypothetical protein